MRESQGTNRVRNWGRIEKGSNDEQGEEKKWSRGQRLRKKNRVRSEGRGGVEEDGMRAQRKKERKIKKLGGGRARGADRARKNKEKKV